MFNIGDSVVGIGSCDGISIHGLFGTIIAITEIYGVEWDGYNSRMHDCNGCGKNGHCWWVFADNIRLANEADETAIDENEFFKIIET